MRIPQIIAELACSLAHQHSAEVCAFWQRGTPAEKEWTARLQIAGIPFFFANPLGSARRPAAYLPGLGRILQRYPPGTGSFDIVHSHFQLGSLAALLLRRKQAAKRAVRTAHVTLE